MTHGGPRHEQPSAERPAPPGAHDTPEHRRGGVLMVLFEDPLSDIIAKGEVIDRYYNPGDYFDEVHLVTLSGDIVPTEAAQRLVGTARLTIHPIAPPRRFFLRTLGWRPALMRPWTARIIDVARRVRPDLIRCHGSRFPAFAAAAVKHATGTPYVVSVHLNPDEDWRGRARNPRENLVMRASATLERKGLQAADRVLPVYRSILPYLARMNVTRTEVAYNVLNQKHIRAKEDYGVSGHLRIVSVGRQIPAKDPQNLIRAVAAMPDAELMLYGDGPIHADLKRLAASLGAADRIRFQRAAPNDELCAALPTYDLFAVHTEYWEISKSVLEALLTGLPVIINARHGRPVEELAGGMVHYVENTPEGYRAALETLATDHGRREALGRFARREALARWSPQHTEPNFVRIYQEILAGGAR